MVASVKCTLAGGPIKSKEGQYYLYYSPNTATAAFSAPITEIDFSNEAFINGYNTTFSCKESDRVNNALPSFSSLRMRTDEYKKLMQAMKDNPAVLRTGYAYVLLAEKNHEKAEEISRQFEKQAEVYPYPQEILSERELMDIAASRAKMGV